jgi:hypothetical protein
MHLDTLMGVSRDGAARPEGFVVRMWKNEQRRLGLVVCFK